MLALALLLAALFAPPTEVVTETLPDGRTVEREVVRDADGNATNEGSYKEFWPDGEEAVRGRYKDGLRHGKWRFYYPSGKRQAVGWYLEGFRDREWEFWDEEGELDENRSGEYAIETLEYGREQPRSRGETRNGERHGTWEFFWEEGGLRARGEYVADQMEGEWLFFHPDGTFDPTWVSGVYETGRRVGDLPEGSGPDPSEGAPPSPPADRDDRVERLSSEDPDERARVAAELHASVKGDVPAVLALLGSLDVAVPDQRRFAKQLQDQHLIARWSGARFTWRIDDAPEAVEINRTAVRRWLTLERTTRDLPGFAAFTVPDAIEQGRAAGAVVPLEQIHPPLFDGSGHELVTRHRGHRLGARFPSSPERLALAAREAPSEAAVAAALRWLDDHQDPLGSWRPDRFESACEERGAKPCGDQGEGMHATGMTGLALLAFLGAGNTIDSGPYAVAVTAGVGWLLTQQDAKTGLVGQKIGHAFLYNHAIATMALCEAACFTESRAVHEAAQRAVDYCVAARNPYSAWRYDVPPSGDNDTSMTVWMIQALRTAELARLSVDETCFDGALAWIDEVTDAESGRCGYDAAGSPSARIPQVNDQYPPRLGEPMTAAALYSRILIGQTPDDEPMLARHAALLLDKPPDWAPEALGCDMYYWYYGTCAMRQMGGPDYWIPWIGALEREILQAQRQDGDAAGSWDPVGPWGYAGGRLYSTAMLTLSLEAYYRYPRVLERL